MTLTFITTVSTKVTKDHDAVITTLTIDTSNLNEQQCREYCAMHAIVPWQSKTRAKGTIPTTDTYVLAPVGFKSAVIDYSQALIKAIGPDMAYKAMQKYGTAEKACNVLKALFDVPAEDTQDNQ